MAPLMDGYFPHMVILLPQSPTPYPVTTAWRFGLILEIPPSSPHPPAAAAYPIELARLLRVGKEATEKKNIGR